MTARKPKPKTRMDARQERLNQALKDHGGVCQTCGADDGADLRFHHRAGEEKRWTHSQIWQHKDTDRAEELAKCVLLCADCRTARKSTDEEAVKASAMSEAELNGRDPSKAHHTMAYAWDDRHRPYCWKCTELWDQKYKRDAAHGEPHWMADYLAYGEAYHAELEREEQEEASRKKEEAGVSHGN